MFAVSVDNHVYFQNDVLDVLSLFRGNMDISQEKALFCWLEGADFHEKYEWNGNSILCVTDEEARKMAAFYQVLPEFEKNYGRRVVSC